MGSQADAAEFAELKARVDKLEAAVEGLRGQAESKESLHDEVLGKPVDPEARRAKRAELDSAFGRRERGNPPQT